MGDHMATRKARVSFMISRFKSFWKEYKQNKRGVIGIIIILFFGVIAVAAPLLTPYDPLRPTHPGFYPARQPPIAEKQCVPIWYKYLPGGQDLSENVEAVLDHEFSSNETFYKEWVWTHYPPKYNVTVRYNATGGRNNNDGTIEISYKREDVEVAPGNVSVTLFKEFEYPFNSPPKSFWMHLSCRIDNRTILTTYPIAISVRLSRGKEVFSVWNRHVRAKDVASKWEDSWAVSKGLLGMMEETIFTNAGNYTYEVKLTIFDNGEGKTDLTIRLDNVNMLLYGSAFGLLGTDVDKITPRDLLTRLVHGTRISFMIGLLAAFFSVIIGLFVGLISGYVGGLVDEVLMRFADFLLILPGLVLLIVLVTVLGRSIWNIIGVLIFMGWMGFSRQVRSMVLSLRERQFIESAKAAGGGTFYIINRHIIPNVFALVYIALATSVPGAILAEASLAWLGLGDINIPSWGMMLHDFSRAGIALKGLGETWFWVLPPGIAIALMAMAFILIGFSLDEILNPKLRKRR